MSTEGVMPDPADYADRKRMEEPVKYPTDFWNEMAALISSAKKQFQMMRDSLTEQQKGMRHVVMVEGLDVPHPENQERHFLQEHRNQVDLVLHAFDKMNLDLAEIENRVNAARVELGKVKR